MLKQTNKNASAESTTDAFFCSISSGVNIRNPGYLIVPQDSPCPLKLIQAVGGSKC